MHGEDLADKWADGAANIAACRKALEAFFPCATPTLMAELTEAVDRHEDRVRLFHKMPATVKEGGAACAGGGCSGAYQQGSKPIT